MRLKLGRPDLARYSDLLRVPAAAPGSTLSVTFLGVSTLHVTDGVTSLLTDGYFSRPPMMRLLTRPVSTDKSRVSATLARAGIGEVAAVMPVHTHFDHVLDSPEVARRTGAVVVGGESAANVARGAGLGVGQLGIWAETVRAVGARRVVLTHWDDFFRPLDVPLRALPYAGDDLDVTLRVLRELAEHDQVELLMPQVWVREDPWRGLA
jgi:L-ascorbate metabolism protein UlaG (beta-lactamase superfamily)